MWFSRNHILRNTRRVTEFYREGLSLCALCVLFISQSTRYLWFMVNQLHVDQMGRSIYLSPNPSRIISLVPSQTELLHHLELSDQVVGITKFCSHPTRWKSEKEIVGGTKKFNFNKIDALQPDLIIGNMEENYPEGIDRLKEKYPVWMSDVNTLSDAIQMITSIGWITDRVTLANKLVKEIESKFNAFEKADPPVTVLYFIWKEPWMVAGAHTFIDDMLNQIGFRNCASDLPRYPMIDEDIIGKLDPEFILLSSEPYPFNKEHVKQLAAQFRDAKVMLVNGEYFSWYGSRLLQAPDYFKNLIKRISTR